MRQTNIYILIYPFRLGYSNRTGTGGLIDEFLYKEAKKTTFPPL